VAKIAGMPRSVVERANRIMTSYSADRQGSGRAITPPLARPKKRGADDGSTIQLTMFQLDDPVLVQIRDQIKGLDINSLTPLEALNKLSEIKKITGL
jgi:DNA mismatch repair protein MutS